MEFMRKERPEPLRSRRAGLSEGIPLFMKLAGGGRSEDKPWMAAFGKLQHLRK